MHLLYLLNQLLSSSHPHCLQLTFQEMTRVCVMSLLLCKNDPTWAVCMPEISVLEGLRQEDYCEFENSLGVHGEFGVDLGYIMNPSLKNRKSRGLERRLSG